MIFKLPQGLADGGLGDVERGGGGPEIVRPADRLEHTEEAKRGQVA